MSSPIVEELIDRCIKLTAGNISPIGDSLVYNDSWLEIEIVFNKPFDPLTKPDLSDMRDIVISGHGRSPFVWIENGEVRKTHEEEHLELVLNHLRKVMLLDDLSSI